METIDKETGEVTPRLVINIEDARTRRKLGLDSTIDVAVINANLTGLLTLYQSAKLSADDLKEAINGTAEKAGVHPSALRRFVAARASEKYDEKRAECEQLQLLFEEVP